MNNVNVVIGDELFEARLQDDLAPKTCARFRSLLPWSERLIHVRWSGEGCWIPLGDLDLDLGFESATSCPAPGQFVLYPGGISETEILLAYGQVSFGSKAGALVGNPFLTLTGKLDRLAAIGRETLWRGAQSIKFSQ